MSKLNRTLNDYGNCPGGYDIRVSGSLYSTKRIYSESSIDFIKIAGTGISYRKLTNCNALFVLKRKNPRASLSLTLYDNESKMSFKFKIKKVPDTWYHQSIEYIMVKITQPDYFVGVCKSSIEEIIHVIKQTLNHPEEKTLSDVPTQNLLDEVLNRYQKTKLVVIKTPIEYRRRA